MGLLHTMEATLLERRVWSGALDMLPAPAFLTLLLILVPLHPLLHIKVTILSACSLPSMLIIVCVSTLASVQLRHRNNCECSRQCEQLFQAKLVWLLAMHDNCTWFDRALAIGPANRWYQLQERSLVGMYQKDFCHLSPNRRSLQQSRCSKYCSKVNKKKIIQRRWFVYVLHKLKVDPETRNDHLFAQGFLGM